MNEQEHERLRDVLKQSFSTVNHELERDLWPRMRRRLYQRSSSAPWFAVLFSAKTLAEVPWFDWALLTALALAVCMFPRSIPIWLYHL